MKMEMIGVQCWGEFMQNVILLNDLETHAFL